MLYREATLGDVAAIAALHAASWRFAYRGSYSDEYLDGPVDEDRLNVWQERLSSPPANQFVVVGEEDGRMAGFACSFGESDERWGALLDNLHVLQEWQRHGIGRGLVSETAKWCAARYPGSGLYLWVLENNARARRFYEGIGGRAEDSQESAVPGGGIVLGRRYVWSRDQVHEMR
jgi:ribosomal protein S18 acetylase RimI-like enzyme